MNALRRIRRDIQEIDKLYKKENVSNFYIKQNKKLNLATSEELQNKTEDCYSLYWDNSNKQDYSFYIKPNDNWRKWISIIKKFPDNGKICFIPNTFDFEFLDSNARRNDIFYKTNNYQRALKLKSNRPYEIEEYWDRFKTFKELFKEKSNTAKLNKLVSIFYDCFIIHK